MSFEVKKPAAFDADKMAELFLQEHPMRVSRNRIKDYLVILLDHIHKTWLKKYEKSKVGKKGGVPVHVSIFEKLVGRNYGLYVNFLYKHGWLSAGVNDKNPYRAGRKSRSFRVTYGGKKTMAWEPYFVKDGVVLRKIGKNASELSKKRKEVESKASKLKEVFEKAAASIRLHEKVYQRLDQLCSEELLTAETPEKQEEVKRNYHNLREVIDKVNRGELGQFAAGRDLKGERFHSVFTNLKKELRRYVLYNGEPMDELDIRNSQPYFLLVMLQPTFWHPDGPRKGLPHVSQVDRDMLFRFEENVEVDHREDLRAKGFRLPLTTQPDHKVKVKAKDSRTGEEQEVEVQWKKRLGSIYLFAVSLHQSESGTYQLFERLVVSGNFYDYLVKKYKGKFRNQKNEDLLKDRETAKQTIITELFEAPERVQTRYYSDILGSLFPDIAQFIAAVKKRSSQNFALLLQRLEARLFLELVVTECLERDPDLAVISVHDSVLVPQSKSNDLKKLLEERLEELVGSKPQIRHTPSAV